MCCLPRGVQLGPNWHCKMGKIPRKSGSEARDDSKGQRKEVLDEEMKHTVEHATLISKYMARSSRKTEFHKSTNEARNTPRDDLKHICNQCRRQFQDDINLTLHVYWHSRQDEKEIAIQQGLHVADDLEEEDQSLCQPMDQAVLNCVKVSQKMSFYFGLFEYCETHGYGKDNFNNYLKSYTVYHAIKDIYKGWQNVPETTIQKSFRKVFPQEKFESITGIYSTNEANFEGFENSNSQPVIDPETLTDTNYVHVMAKENVPNGLEIRRSQILNHDFDKDIELIVNKFKSASDYIVVTKENLIEDVLLNPGPKDDDLDNITREELGLEDVDMCDDMLQEEPFDIPFDRHPKTPREGLQDYVKKLSELKYHEFIHDILPKHDKENDKDEHLKLIQQLKDLSIKCFKFCKNKLPDVNCLNVCSSDIEKDKTTFRALNAHEIQQRKKKS